LKARIGPPTPQVYRSPSDSGFAGTQVLEKNFAIPKKNSGVNHLLTIAGLFSFCGASPVAPDRNASPSGFSSLNLGRTSVRPFFLCAEHERQLGGGSPLLSLMAAKG
jgi:hypothetical protein